MIKKGFRFDVFFLVGSWSIVFFISINPAHIGEPHFFNGDDMLKHILTFFVLSYFFAKSKFKVHNILMCTILVMFAMLIEILQFFTGREPSIKDFVYSVLGVALFVLVERLWDHNVSIDQ